MPATRARSIWCAANPAAPAPRFLAAPDGARLICALGPADLDEAVELLAGAYWNENVDRQLIARAQLGATAWVGARDRDGRLVASARAITDGAKWAGLFDVMVAPGWRGRGLGEALVRLLVDHPRVRGARRVWLATKDAQLFYARLGFTEGKMVPPLGFATTEMVLAREM
jgi:GNAT superfamily N-acetyltransferase